MKNSTIALYRDADYAGEYRLMALDADYRKVPVDITEGTLECAVVDAPGGSVVLASGTVEKTVPNDGRFSLRFDGAAYAAFGHLQEPSPAYYRVRLTLGGQQTNVLAGTLNILPGT